MQQMGNSKSTNTTTSRDSPLKTVDIHLTILHNSGQSDIRVDRTCTIGDIKKRWDYCDFNGILHMDPQSVFSYTGGIGENTKFIINDKVASDDETLNNFLKTDQTDLNVLMLHKVHGNFIRYKCINCAYSGSIEYYSGSISCYIRCYKCHYQLPSPNDVITNYHNSANTPSATNTLQRLLEETHSILPTLLSILNHQCIPINIIQCIISCCIGEIQGFTENNTITFQNKHRYHYALIYNPFKPYVYEWIPTVVHQSNHNNQTIVLLNHSNSEIEEICTDYNHKYETCKHCKDFGIFESEKECKIYIGCQVIHFEKAIYWNIAEGLNKQNDGKVEFEIKTLTGKSIMARFDLNESVLSLKQFVLDHEGIPLEQQCFISPFGRGMEDHKSLNNYGIMQGFPVRLVLRLRGGHSNKKK